MNEHITCRWCGAVLTELPTGWVDADGWFNCGKYRRHWPRDAAPPEAG